MNTCEALLTSGDRRGQVCGKRALSYVGGGWYCGRHRASYNAGAPPVLCTYEPPFPLWDPVHYNAATEDVRGEENIAALNGYINIRIGHPILRNQESVPLALISSVSPGEANFNKKSLATELASCIKHIIERPDVYDLGHTSLDGLVLEKITYDTVYGIFRAHVDVVP